MANDQVDDLDIQEELRGWKQRYIELQQRYEWLEAMINHVPDYIYAKDREGRFLFANDAIVVNNGFAHVDDLIGLTDADIHPSSTAEEIALVERRVIETGEPDLGVEERRLKGDGWLMMSRVPLRNPDGATIGVVGASRDITARKRAEALMNAQSKLLHQVARGVDLDGFLADASASLDELVGLGQVVIILDTGADPASAPAREFPINSRDGRRHGNLIAPNGIPNEPNVEEFLEGVAQTIGIAIDRDRDVAKIAFLAEHDALTGLPNRAVLDRKIEAMLRSSPWSSVIVAFVDLDNFKLVNDSLGHAAGDQLLQVIARRISTQIGSDGVVSRIGGDEFIVVMQDEPEVASEKFRSILAATAEPLTVGGVEMRITCSIGVACRGLHGETASKLFANADMALYKVKERGRNGMQMFRSEMADEARDKLGRIEELRRAIELEEFVVYYQPQTSVATGRITSVEALVRWQHPYHGLLAPDRFIPLAEETGLIVAIGEIVLRKACRQAMEWQRRGLPLRVAVNVSARQFLEATLVDQVASVLADTGLSAEWLELEITESLIMQDAKRAVERMHELKVLGMSLSIDDFGTGYSSLSTLKNFPISRLKIDRSFIREIPHDTSDMAITSAIVSLGRILGLEIVAEGVETNEQAEFLAQSGCDIFQGYLISRPLHAAGLDALFAAHSSSTLHAPYGHPISRDAA
ncbi:EAL domain-containing protein [Rhizobium mesosinicum]|uniref:EAL domain-containing protein n=2 Tax=Rhizobium mesosinicum TaxID=335017 RepID=A0ABS7GM99_9HYPH|nr:EAL domain-containing protein [Rhizobium mesosinicum]